VRRWVRVLTGLSALLIALVPAMTACGGRSEPASAGPQTTTIEISYDDLLKQQRISRSVSLTVGDTLQISLGANPSTGYQWAEQMTITDAKVLTQTGHESIAASEGRPGAAGSDVWVLQAMGPGSATVSTSYSRPWAGGEQDTWSFTADVTVR